MEFVGPVTQKIIVVNPCDEKKYLAIADLPEAERNARLFGTAGAGFPNSLTNGAGKLDGPKTASTPPSPLMVPAGPCSLWEQADEGWRPDQRRDIMESLLRECYPRTTWSRSFWSHIGLYQDAAIDVFDIQDSPYRPFRRYNFAHCYRQHTHGRVYTPISDSATRYRQRYRCSEPGCLDCRDSERRRVAREWLQLWEKTVSAYPGCPGAMELVFTLPEELEDKIFKDKKILKKFMDEIYNFIKKMFGLPLSSNPLCHIAVHPVGGRDLMRNRGHANVLVLPCHLRKTKAGKRVFEWLRPVHTAPDHTDVAWKIDLGWARKEYNDRLHKVFGANIPGANQPEIQFIPYSGEHRKYRHCVIEQVGQIFWQVCACKLRYAARGFGRDLEQAILRSSEDLQLFVLKAQRGDQLSWQVVPAAALAERYKWIQTYNRISTRGWGQCVRKYADVLGFGGDDDETEEDPPEVVPAEAEVEIIREKAYDKDKRKVVWFRDEIYRWFSPITGQYIEMSTKNPNLRPWKGKRMRKRRRGS